MPNIHGTGPATLAILLLLAMAIPATAQQPGRAGSGYGFEPPGGTPLTPHGQGGAGGIPPVERQYDAARQAGPDAAAGPVGLLGSADRALAGNDTGTANELLERAATALLNQPGIEAGPEGWCGPSAPAMTSTRRVRHWRGTMSRRRGAASRRHLPGSAAPTAPAPAGSAAAGKAGCRTDSQRFDGGTTLPACAPGPC